MIITKESVEKMNPMEVGQVMGTFWMMLNAPESRQFINNFTALQKAYDIVYERNVQIFGLAEVTNTLGKFKGMLDMRDEKFLEQFRNWHNGGNNKKPN